MFDLIDANTTDMGVIAALVAVVLIVKYARRYENHNNPKAANHLERFSRSSPRSSR